MKISKKSLDPSLEKESPMQTFLGLDDNLEFNKVNISNLTTQHHVNMSLFQFLSVLKAYAIQHQPVLGSLYQEAELLH